MKKSCWKAQNAGHGDSPEKLQVPLFRVFCLALAVSSMCFNSR